MPVTYPTHSSLTPRSVAFTSKTQATSFQSPFSGQQQVVQYSGQWWECVLSYPPLFDTAAEQLVGFINGLNGTVGTFYWSPPSRYMITSSITATLGAAGNAFSETNGQVGKFGIDQTSYRLVQFTGTGSLFPRLPSGTHTVSTSTGALFRLLSNEQTFTIDEMRSYGLSLAIREAI